MLSATTLDIRGENTGAGAPRTLLEVRNLSVTFQASIGRQAVSAVQDVNFTVHEGRTLCLVGESGSGKSVTARAILGLVEEPGQIAGGQILYHREDGIQTDLAALDPKGKPFRSIRGNEIAMIFQEPMTSLSPVHTIGSQIIEAIRLHQLVSRKQAREQAIELLRQVEIPSPEAAIDRYTFEYSGGMRQRAMIAMALSCSPRLLIADEPTTALDVTTQAEILDLIARMQKRYGMAVIFITHDMGVVAEIADDVAVMRRSQLLEYGPVRQIFDTAEHGYTRELIESVRRLEHSARTVRGAKVSPQVLLSVRELEKSYGGRATGLGKRKAGAAVRAVKSVSFDLHRGENLGIVGESGSGKTTLANCLMRILEPSAGTITYTREDGSDLEVARAGGGALRAYHRDVRMVFQDPFASLNPRMTVAQILAEPLKVNNVLTRPDDLRKRVGELLDMVGMPADVAERYPHAFSGGQRQRIGIARALALDPRLVVADEATSALDVTLRSQILDLMLDLQERLNLSYIFISHDLGVIRYFCDRVAVMYRGEMVELGPADTVCSTPDHDYTKALLSAAPAGHPDEKRLANRHRYERP
ncbi:ABC transporter ATP-binding protein [Pelagibacterium montanilacus]|uniref:ABC transporter ATP-binding protein n=1 Tax=Pelagibacterium montanilacus TaxID=2185280 RepID=UPI000F8C58BB|nr:ABC transporter ATP-binding protein [Pelagibacterium montanilacus]